MCRLDRARPDMVAALSLIAFAHGVSWEISSAYISPL